ELLYGRLVPMTIHPPHSHFVKVLTKLFVIALGDRADVLVQSPIASSDDSEPEPDLSIVPAATYFDDHPSRALLIIEVADSTLKKDRTVKAQLYAETGVPEYWIVDGNGAAIEVYSQPIDGRYSSVVRYSAGQTVSPTAFPDIVVSLDALFSVRSR
ncbi:MAG: Uma2 family endonuclease, partial [Myxococcaceae bacterium]|nr:Uma2 family endonuclease [Myxococcaceae bacterium]